mmetsp:Transcript_1856/g.4066  ORF Transcript_1856/g.4066 Transcript_1856/m.4066 type:complete len:206 (+) Transcript_1856:1927-2544(+)
MAKNGFLSPNGEGTFVSLDAMYRKLTKFAARYLFDTFIVASVRITGLSKTRRGSTEFSAESPDEVLDIVLFELNGFSVSKELRLESENFKLGFNSTDTSLIRSATKRHMRLKCSFFSKSDRATSEKSVSFSRSTDFNCRTSVENQEIASSLGSFGTLFSSLRGVNLFSKVFAAAELAIAILSAILESIKRGLLFFSAFFSVLADL